MAGPCVWVCVLVLVLVGETSTTSAQPPHLTPKAENCQGDALSSLRQTAGCSPACVASSLTLCSQIQEQNQLSVFVEEMREIMQELRAPKRPCPGWIIEEGEQWRPRHCKDLLDEGDSGRGVRQIYPFPGRSDNAADVYCDHTIDGGGWTVFQHRTNSTTREDFYRTWAEYQQGFGNLKGEFWMGLDLLSILTSSPQELRVDLSDFEGGQRWAKYSSFSVGSPQDNYTLTILRYTGDAGDSMDRHNGSQFSTHDADHDAWPTGNCAERYKGAWWYKDCYDTNPNGYQYERNNGPSNIGIIWYHWKGWTYSLRNTTFRIRPTA